MTTNDSQRVVPVELLPCPFCASPINLKGDPDGEDDLICFVCSDGEDCKGTGLVTLTQAKHLDTAIAAWNRRAPAASPSVAPIAAAQEGVSASWWRYVGAGFETNFEPLVPFEETSERHRLREQYARENGLTIELAYSRPPAQTQPDTPEDRRDGERWRAFINCARISLFGYAGFDSATGLPKGDNSVHFGADFWSRHAPCEQPMRAETTALLIAFADASIAAIDAAQADHEGV